MRAWLMGDLVISMTSAPKATQGCTNSAIARNRLTVHRHTPQGRRGRAREIL